MVTLSSMWERIQSSLFPFLEEELGPLTKKQQKLISILEIIRIEDSISYTYKTGRPPADRKAIARAFAAFAESRLPEEVHEALIKKHMSEHLVGHISRDSTEIVAREKPVTRKKTKQKQSNRKRGRPKKGETVSPKEQTRIEKQKAMTLEEMLADLPTVCDRGTKINSKGYKESWNGYKLHLDTADGQIPITLLLTSASLHDSQSAIPLAIMTSQRLTNLYDLMDSAYDCEGIKEFSQKLEHVPIIDPNHRRGKKQELDPAEKTRYNERTTVERVFGRLKDEFGG